MLMTEVVAVLAVERLTVVGPHAQEAQQAAAAKHQDASNGASSRVARDVADLWDDQAPELTDEWVQSKIGVDTVEDLRKEMAEEIESQRASVLPRLKESRVLTAITERLVGEVPENLVEDAESTLLSDFFNQLQRQGMTLDAYLQQSGITSQKFREDIKLQAADMAAQDLALDAYAAHAGIVATDEEIRDEFVNAGAEDPDKLMEQWRENGQMYLVRQGVLRQKAVKQLIDGAVVTEEKPEESEEKAGKHAAKEEASEAADEPEIVDEPEVAEPEVVAEAEPAEAESAEAEPAEAE